MDATWFFDHRPSGFSLLLGPPSWTRQPRRIASDAAPRRHRRRRTASDRRQRPRPSCQSIRSSSRHNSRRIRRRASPTPPPTHRLRPTPTTTALLPINSQQQPSQLPSHPTPRLADTAADAPPPTDANDHGPPANQFAAAAVTTPVASDVAPRRHRRRVCAGLFNPRSIDTTANSSDTVHRPYLMGHTRWPFAT
jgi:hypothetical protein